MEHVGRFLIESREILNGIALAFTNDEGGAIDQNIYFVQAMDGNYLQRVADINAVERQPSEFAAGENSFLSARRRFGGLRVLR
jgi:hypothetical protein